MLARVIASHRRVRSLVPFVLLIAAGQSLGATDSSITNIQSISNITTSGAVDGKRAYSFGVSFCNPGTTPLAWQASTPNHGVSTPNLYRLANGRFEQIGIGWCAHEFFALGQGGVCGTCASSDGSILNPGCMTPTSQSYTMSQQNLSMRSSINPFTGVVTFPFPRDTGPTLFKRLQANESDLDVAGAFYFVEQATIHYQDAAPGIVGDNYGYRPLSFAAVTFNASFAGVFVAQPAIYAWHVVDHDVQITIADVPGEGRFILGARATDLGGGQWSYEYAIENLNSKRAAGGFSVPVSEFTSASAIGFHDIDYHSGEPYDTTDWTGSRGLADVSWTSPQDFASNPNSNALRWGTIYNFRFITNTAPTTGEATVTLFEPGSPASISVSTIVPLPAVPACPGDADGDRVVGLADIAAIINAWGAMVAPGTPPDLDGSGSVGVGDVAEVINHWAETCP